MNPSKFIYDQENMRRHLTECLENQKFCNFPFSVNYNWKKKKVTKTREHIYCICRGLYDSEMVQCVICETWLPHRCLDVRTVFVIYSRLSLANFSSFFYLQSTVTSKLTENLLMTDDCQQQIPRLLASDSRLSPASS